MQELKEPVLPAEDSEYMKAWKALPRSGKEKLTKKQIARIDKPDLLFDSLVPEVKSKRTAKVVVTQEYEEKKMLEPRQEQQF